MLIKRFAWACIFGGVLNIWLFNSDVPVRVRGLGNDMNATIYLILLGVILLFISKKKNR